MRTAGGACRATRCAILDSKNPAMQAGDRGRAAADRLSRDAESREHFEGVRAGLADLGIAATVNPRLVRGMDYYNRTVFEWVTDKLGAQATVCGGGRYDPLVEHAGRQGRAGLRFRDRGRATARPGRAGGGIECRGTVPTSMWSAAARRRRRRRCGLSEQLRAAGIDVLMHAGGGSFKSQFSRADASGASLALIIGDDEVARSEVGLKPLRGGPVPASAGGQQAIPFDAVVERVQAALLGDGDRDRD